MSYSQAIQKYQTVGEKETTRNATLRVNVIYP